MRRAVEEDNDDIVPLIEMQTTRLKDLYGDYYIAEIINRHPQSGRQLIVAEYKEEAVAVMCVTEKINYDLINTHFELLPFYGLKKPSDRDHIPKTYRTSAYSNKYQIPEQITPISSHTSMRALESIVSEEIGELLPLSFPSIPLKVEECEVRAEDDRAAMVEQILSRHILIDDSDLMPIARNSSSTDEISSDSLHSESFDIASISLLSWCNEAKLAEKDQDSDNEPVCKHEYELEMNKDMLKLLKEIGVPSDLGKSVGYPAENPFVSVLQFRCRIFHKRRGTSTYF